MTVAAILLTEFTRQANDSHTNTLHAELGTLELTKKRSDPCVWSVVVQKTPQILDMLLLPAAKVSPILVGTRTHAR